MTPWVSVLVPAHDEEQVIGRCLKALLAGVDVTGVEVLVVANGCTDRTAQVARLHGADVLEVATASKVGALRAGDEMLATLPRVYLDADVVLGPGALQALARELASDLPRVGAPRAIFRTEGRPWVVRSFYEAYTRLPYVSGEMVGSGVYALSAAGRARFDTFPDLTADDLFVQRLFSSSETFVLPDVSFTVETPRTVKGLLAVRTRTARGNRQMASQGGPSSVSSTGSTVKALVTMVRAEPRIAISAGLYVAVTVLARWRSRRSGLMWDRDTSTR